MTFYEGVNRKTSFMVRMDNLSAATVTSRFLPVALTAFIGFIQLHY